MRVTLNIALWQAFETHSHGKRARKYPPRSPTRGAGSQAGGVRAFGRLFPLIRGDARRSLCTGLGEIEDSLYDELAAAVKHRDIYTIDKATEELKWTNGASRSCRLR